jgi:ABC-type transport system involved in multi-copper enzyme maturation permease subunit
MNPLVKKEIRLLLPSFLISLLLALSIWLLPEDLDSKSVSVLARSLIVFPFLFCPVMLVMMILGSFGREFSSGTFSMLLAQPVPRARIWWTKTLPLAVMVVLVWFVWCISGILHFNPANGSSTDMRDTEIASGLFVLAMYSGGLWSVLLLRQMAAGFWFAVLTPTALLMTIINLLDKQPDKVEERVLIAAFIVYGIAGFLFARWLFFRAQDVAWTGGTIVMPEAHGLARFKISSGEYRIWRPRMALFIKEFQLHQSQFLIVGILVLLHLGIIATRKFGHFPPNSSLEFALEQFWWLWLVMPVLVGCAAVAEERNLGVMEGQLCLPVSRRAQFAIKFIPTMIFGVLLGGVMPILLETLATHLGAPGEFFKPEGHAYDVFGSSIVLLQISIVALAAGLAWVGFFASTLAKNFLQALSIAFATILGCVLFVPLVIIISKQRMTFFDIIPWHPLLPILIAILVIPATLLWLAWLNFKHFHENWRLWQRNIVGIGGALLFIIVSSAAIYNRAWEVFEPAEPPHGPAKFSLANSPELRGNMRGSLLVQLPDGRVWFDSLSWGFFENQPSRWKELWLKRAPPLPKSAGPQQFIAGSNWVSATASCIDWWTTEGATNIHIFGYRDTVGIQADGTLWISGEAKPIIWTGARMIRFGDETNWQQVTRSDLGFLLLKRDGTLWQWGTNHYDWHQWQTNWPTVRNWKEICSASWNNHVRKTDGSVWAWSIYPNSKTGKDELEQETNLDQVVFQTFSHMNDVRMGYVSTNGTLWICNSHSVEYENGSCSWQQGTGFLQVGKETNWLAVAVNWGYMVALKSDGSLWKWNFTRDSTAKAAKIPPTQLGIHSDWVGLTGTWMGTVSLAADGSLWLWPGMEDYYGVALLKPPKQPEFLGNVFGKAD